MVYGTTPVSTTALGTNQFPIGAVASPDTPGGNLTAAAGYPGAYQDTNSNPATATMIQMLTARIVQQAHAVTGSAGKTVAATFPNQTQKGNSIVVCVGMGEVEGANITLTITDTLGNTYQEVINASQSTTLESAIFLATYIGAGSNTVTATIAGTSSSNTAMGIQIYEVYGPIIYTAGAIDGTAIGSNAGSTAVSTAAITPLAPNELFFTAIAAAGGVITPGTNWTLDSGSLSPTGGNLVSFGAQSRQHALITALTPAATLSASNAWAAASASFKAVIVPIAGSVNIAQIGGVVTQLAAPADANVLTNTPIFVVGLNGGGTNAERWRSANAIGDNFGTGVGVVQPSLFNGSGADRQRNNQDTITLISASAVTTTQTSADQTNYNAHGVYIVVNVTTLTGTSPTLTPLLQGKGPVSVQYFGIGAALTAIAATGKFVYFYILSAPAAAGGVTASIAFAIPRTWNFVMTAGGTITNATYTVEALIIL